ncbi:protein of unknown function [Lachnospiraceae bacterium NE2001]|nr:protein of unknown function [Lachnospiraceae bacterium NE2001]
MRKKVSMILVTLMMVGTLAACGSLNISNETAMDSVSAESAEDELEQAFSDTESKTSSDKSTQDVDSDKSEEDTDCTASNDNASTVVTTANVTSGGMIDATDMFTDRDLEQTADLSEAEYHTLSDGKDITITAAGVYVISGDAENVTIYVEADDEDKIQLVLDGTSISNDSAPAIYVKSADKVFVTTTDSENSLEVTGDFAGSENEADDTNLDAVVFSKDDLVINGVGTLNITSSDNGVTSKDTLKITGSTINVSCTGNAFEAHDAIEIADGYITVTSCNDGLRAKDSDDDTVGYIYICGGTFDITANDDAIHATTIIQIDDGSLNLAAAECIEGTYIQINGGTITINASDDGINAAQKSSAYTPTFEINDGSLKITMGAGDTDGIDSNGNIYVNGGTVDISGQSTFDYDGTAEYNGGTIIENGSETNTITNQFFGGGPGGGFGGGDHGGPSGGFNDDGFGGGGFGGPGDN